MAHTERTGKHMAKTKARTALEKIGQTASKAKGEVKNSKNPKKVQPQPKKEPAPVQPAGVGRGRPKGDNRPHTVWLPPDVWQAVRLAAFTEEKSHSHIIHRAICASLGLPFTDEE